MARKSICRQCTPLWFSLSTQALHGPGRWADVDSVSERSCLLSSLQYPDDFLLFGPPDSPVCQEALDTTLATCEELVLPVAPDKIEGPTTALTFLGIEIDTEATVASAQREAPESDENPRGMEVPR